MFINRGLNCNSWIKGSQSQAELAIREIGNTDCGPGKRDLMMKLSPREREVLALLVEEGRLKPVAAALDRSVHTVQSHKSSIMRKLHARNSVEMICFAIRKGLVKP